MKCYTLPNILREELICMAKFKKRKDYGEENKAILKLRRIETFLNYKML